MCEGRVCGGRVDLTFWDSVSMTTRWYWVPVRNSTHVGTGKPAFCRVHRSSSVKCAALALVYATTQYRLPQNGIVA